MRLVQKAAEKAGSAAHTPPTWHQQAQQGGHAGYEEAPWLGHGGVHHMDAGHLGQHYHMGMTAISMTLILEPCAP